jgi:ferric-dicitrate binding protein FerR (iron transport regulator)
MNMHKEKNNLISKYLQGEATEEEVEILFDWADSAAKNKEELIASKKVWALSAISNTTNTLDLKKVQLKIKAVKNKKWRLIAFKYAAVLVFGLFIASVFVTHFNVGDTSEIVLEMSNGTRKIIALDGNQDIVSREGEVLGIQRKGNISYEDNTATASEELRYNTLSVPYAKRLHLVLSDGSSVSLNAGTTIKFPVKFLKGQPREVFIDGEAFFDIVKDKNHAFIVQGNRLRTKVYGTKFNVSSYKNNDADQVVLQEGSVGVKPNGKHAKTEVEVLLKPNEIAILDRAGLLYKKEVDVASHIAWVKGVFMFKNERLEDIFKKLERHYDVSIQNNQRALNDSRYTGTFDIETIAEVFNSFSKLKGFTYEIDKKEITINP